MKVLDLFSGAAGGWSVGLERAGYRTVAACEIDPWRRGVFAGRHPGCLMYDDVRGLTAERLRADLGALPDVVVGSPPCQEISAANCKGEGITDDHLFWEWVRLVFEIRPLWCAAENSPRARADGIDGILDALAQAGYAAWPCVVGADSAGANHRRKRMWLVAADAHGRIESRTWRHTDGCLSLGTGADGRLSRDAQILGGLRQRRVLGGSGAEPAKTDLRDHPPNSDREGLAVRPRFARNDGEELPPALRDIGIAWPDWNGGLPGLAAACAAAGFGALDDGADAGLPAGLRNRAIAALGDAVIPQIPEAIGRAMMEIMP